MGRSDPPESPREPWTKSILPVAAGLGQGRSAHSREPAIRKLRERWRARRERKKRLNADRYTRPYGGWPQGG